MAFTVALPSRSGPSVSPAPVPKSLIQSSPDTTLTVPSTHGQAVNLSYSFYPGSWQPEFQAPCADVIAIGSAEEILPARWNTPDGSQPATLGTGSPQVGTFIYSP